MDLALRRYLLSSLYDILPMGPMGYSFEEDSRQLITSAVTSGSLKTTGNKSKMSQVDRKRGFVGHITLIWAMGPDPFIDSHTFGEWTQACLLDMEATLYTSSFKSPTGTDTIPS